MSQKRKNRHLLKNYDDFSFFHQKKCYHSSETRFSALTRSDYQKCISVWTELVIPLKSLLVGLHYFLISSESSHGHQHSGFRGVEVGNYGVRNRKAVRREDEFVGPAVERFHLVISGDKGLKPPYHSNADRKDLMTGILGAVDLCGCLRSDDKPLGIHLVLGQVLHIHCAEVSYAHMQGDVGLVDILEYHPVKQFTTEMKAGSRR